MTTGANPLRVLVVDDEPAIRRFLRATLTGQGYIVSELEDGLPVLDAVRRKAADVLMLDLGLPDIDGVDIIRRVRSLGFTIPIIVLSSRTEEHAKVDALDSGADDYITKPFGIDELLARVRTAHKHRFQQQGEYPIYRSGGLTVDLVRRRISMRGAELKLSPREFGVLSCLVEHAGTVLTHRHLLQKVWGDGTDIQYLRIYIRALRQKIEPDPERPTYILTETGVGYRLRATDHDDLL